MKKKQAYKVDKELQKKLSKARKRAAEVQRNNLKRFNIEIQRPMHGRSFSSESEVKNFITSLENYVKNSAGQFRMIGSGENKFAVRKDELKQINEYRKLYLKNRENFYKDIAKKKIIAGGKVQEDSVINFALRKKQIPGDTYYDLINPNTFNPKTISNRNQFNMIMSRYARQSDNSYWEWRDKIMRDNFVKSLQRLSERTGINSDSLQQQINDMETADFIELYYRGSSDLESVFFNTPDSMKMFEDVNQIFNNVQADINALQNEK